MPSDDNVLEFKSGAIGSGIKLDADAVLAEAVGGFKTVIIVGITKAGDLRICGTEGLADTVLLLESAKHTLIAKVL